MQRMLRVVLVVSGLAIWATGRARTQEKAPRPLPADVVATWQKVGGRSGWMGPDEFGFLVFRSTQQAKAGDVPALRFDRWKPGVLGQLPAPANAFGLSVRQMTDEGLKELVSLKQMQALDLSSAEVTDAGLKELAGLKQLQALNLSWTQVTDLGLKELAAQKQLQSLSLIGTQITDAGLKELARLKELRSLCVAGTQVTERG
jgi:hypothetical protein